MREAVRRRERNDTMNSLVDDKELSGYRQRIKKQFSAEPEFICLHPQEKTQGGVYEFEVTISVDKKRRCFIWRFISSVAAGQMAMEVAEPNTKSPDDIVAQWLATRKQADKMTR